MEGLSVDLEISPQPVTAQRYAVSFLKDEEVYLSQEKRPF